MRARTDVRRQGITDIAAELFREHGYERTSMAQIAARVGGSKTTLYGYFASKEALFAAVMTSEMAAHGEALIAMLDPTSEDLRTTLTAFGRAYLEFMLTAESIAIIRTGFAESGTSSLGAEIYAVGPRRGWRRIAEQLQRWVDLAKLRRIDGPWMAIHLKGLLEAGLIEVRLYGAEPDIDIPDAVDAAIDAFIRAYGL